MKSKALILLLLTALLCGAVSCTTAERKGKNPKPFNTPSSWELNPYDGMFRN